MFIAKTTVISQTEVLLQKEQEFEAFGDIPYWFNQTVEDGTPYREKPTVIQLTIMEKDDG